MTHGGNVWQGEGPKHWLDYSANLRPEGAPEWVKSALLRAVDSAAYYPDPEMKRARRAMAQALNLPEENVLPTAGGISAIDLIARQSERAVLTTPCFEEYERQSREHGAPVRKVSLLDGRRLISPAEALRKELRGGETVWLCNPMNPVGAAFSRDEVAALLPRVGYAAVQVDEAAGTVTLEDGAQIDVGGVAKGFAADELRALLRERDITSALFDLGGNVTALGSKPDGSPWKVGVADPDDPGKLAGLLEVRDATVSTSGAYQRYFEGKDGTRYHHLLDPSTGYPAASDLASASVVGADGAQCDALSTACFVLGLDGALDLWRAAAADGDAAFDLVLIASDGRTFVTDGIADAYTPAAGTNAQVVRS